MTATTVLPSVKKQQGYIALIALLVVASTGLVIGLAMSVAGIDEIQQSFGTAQATKAQVVATSCIEDGLERLRISWAPPAGTLSVGADSCILSSVINGSEATVTAIGTVGTYQQKIQIQVDSSLNVVAWQEE